MKPAKPIKPAVADGELSRVQRELADVRRRLAEVYDFSPVGYLTLDADCGIRETNQAAANLLGVKREHLVSKKFTDFIAPDSLDTFHLYGQLAGKSQVKKGCELQLRREDGSTFSAGIQSIVASADEPDSQRWLVTISDHSSVKRAEDSLREHEHELAAIYDNTPLIVLLIDAHRRVRKMNKFAREFVGGTASHLVGQHPGAVLRCLHALDHQKGCGFGPHCPECPVRRAVMDTLKTGSSHHQVEASLAILRQGRTEELTVLLSTSRLDMRDQPHVLVTIQDITTRKRAEKDLGETAHFLQHLIDAIPNPIYYKDTQGIYRGCNSAFEAYLGIPREKIIGASLHDVSPKDMADKYREMDAALFRQRGVQVYESQVRYADGTQHNVIFNKATFTNVDGSLGGVVGVMLDITERKRAEEAMRRSEQLFRLLFETMLQGVVFQDATGRIIVMNLAAERILGKTLAEDFLGNTLVDEEHPPLREDGSPFPETEQPATVALKTGREVRDVVMAVYNPQKKNYRWIAVRAVPVFRAGEDKPYQAYTIFDDITERKQAEERIAQLNRVQAIFGGVDRAIVHIPDQQKLLDEICRVAVEKGDFKLAWIGMAATDGSVQQAAKAGATGFLDGIRVVTRDEPEGCGPVGTAIRENRAVVIEDIDRDARMAPWRDRAQQFGLRYSAAFPIRIGDQVVGAFSVYAPSAGFFEENELGLLTQMSEEISFALTAIDDITRRRQAEEEVHRSEERYRELVEQAPDGLFVTDLQVRRFLDFNSAACQMFGYSREEAFGLSVLDVLAPGEAARIASQATRVRPGKTVFGEWRLRRKDGSLFSAEIRARLVPGGRIQGFVRDLTEQKRAVAALRESEEKYRGLFESALDAIVTVEPPSWRFTAVNPATVKMFGAKNMEEFISLAPWEMSPERQPDGRDSAEKAREMIETALREGSHFFEWTHRRMNGEEFFADVLLTRMERAGKQIVQATIRDITERKRIEEALRQSEKELAEFFRTSPLGLLWVKPDGHILRVNEAQLELLGCTGKEVLRRPVARFSADPDAIPDLLHRLARGETVQNYHLRLRQKNRSIRQVLVDANGLWEKEQLLHSRWFVRDITRRVELEREILSISEREQRRMGHDLHDDLCQQLAGIEFLCQTLAGQLDKGSSAHAAQAKEIAQLAQNAMTQTRELAHGLSPVALEAEGLMEALQALAARTTKIFRIDCRFQCDKPVLVTDHAVGIHLYRIAQEAVGNAIKHGKARRINIGLTANGNMVALAVCDNGLGIPVKLRKHKGLGMRIMQYRAGVIGGSLLVQRDPNGGTTVICTVADGLLPPNERTLG